MKSIVRVTCGHPGCNEFARYEADNRKHSIDLYARYGNGKWKCVRHSQPDEVLSADNTKTVDEMVVFDEKHGLYWGKDKGFSGFAHGPGFKAFAKDFPVGTVLRVTAEIIFPSPTHPQLPKESAVCPICDKPFESGDVLRPRRNAPGPCHADCLAGIEDRDRETGEAITDNLPTFVLAVQHD